jgi:hypothetical protein
MLLTGLVLAWPLLVPASLVALGGLYAGELLESGAPLDAAVPLVAAGLLTTAELAHWSLEERERLRPQPGEGLRRLAFIAALATASIVVTGLLLVLVDEIRTGGLATTLVGAAAAATVLFAIVLAARRRENPV